MTWIAYNTVHADLKTLIETVSVAHDQGAGFNKVFKNADERDVNFGVMPMADVRLVETDPQIRAGRDYYEFTTFEVEIVAHSLQSQDDAASVRDALLSATLDAVRGNSAFSAVISTSRIGPVKFAFASDEKTGAFVAAATFQVITESYVDRS